MGDVVKNGVCTMVGVIGSLIASQFGGWDAALSTLILFMAVDYITGLVVAGVFHASPKTKSGTLESRAGWKGLCRKGETLLIVLVACRLPPAMTVIFGWGLNKGVSIANGYINNKFAQTCLQNAANAVFNAVQYVNQTYVDALKEQDKFDEAAQRIAYNRALAAAKKALTQETITFIKETFGDLDSYLKPMIEAQVRSQKKLYVMFSRHHENVNANKVIV